MTERNKRTVRKLFAERKIVYLPYTHKGKIHHWLLMIKWWLHDFKSIEWSFHYPGKKSIYKKWRHDLKLWEEKIKLFSITYYRYSLWSDGKVKEKFRLYSL